MKFPSVPNAAWHSGFFPDQQVGRGFWVALSEPIHTLYVKHLDEVHGAFVTLSDWVANGYWITFSVAYEAAPAFDCALEVQAIDTPHAGRKNEPGTELLRAQAYKPEHIQFMPELDFTRDTVSEGFEGFEHPLTAPWVNDADGSEFYQQFQQVRQAIEEGEFYQINLTTRMRSSLRRDSSPLDLFVALYCAQPAEFSFYCDWGNAHTLSLSPELFFRIQGRELTCQPMKGTRAPQMPSHVGDRLSDSHKDRAENVMIVDLLRNDMSRVCEPRSVRVSSLFDVLALPTVEQMTSTLKGQLTEDISLFEVFRALFPCGSVTGAPKSQAMKRIAQWEHSPRGIYCGALGVISPTGAVCVNVPIRTVECRRNGENRQLTAGVGSGLTWYSNATDEYAEWQQKIRFLRQHSERFQILETFKYASGQCTRLPEHLSRMALAASRFDYPFDLQKAQRTIAQHCAVLGEGEFRIRLLLDSLGHFEVQSFPLDRNPESIVLRLAHQPMIASPDFIRFKTSYRPHYEAMAEQAQGCDDVLLIDEEGYLTETCRFNVVIRSGDQWITPPAVRNGQVKMLPGVYRSQLLRDNTVIEAPLTVQSLRAAEQMWVVNSLRGWIRVRQLLSREGVSLFEDSTDSQQQINPKDEP